MTDSFPKVFHMMLRMCVNTCSHTCKANPCQSAFRHCMSMVLPLPCLPALWGYLIYNICIVTLENDLGEGSMVHHAILYTNSKQLLTVNADIASQFNNLELLWHATYDIVTACGEGEEGGLLGIVYILLGQMRF